MLTISWERQMYIYNHNAKEIKIKSPKDIQTKFWQLREMCKIWNSQEFALIFILSGQLKYILPK